MVLCLGSVRLGLEEAETVRATTLKFGVWLCGIMPCAEGGRVGLCLVSLRPGPGEAKAMRATA